MAPEHTRHPDSTPDWHTLRIDATLQALHADAQGLTSAEAAARLARHGPNALPEGRSRSVARMLLDQFSDFMILVLIAAAIVSGIVFSKGDADMLRTAMGKKQKAVLDKMFPKFVDGCKVNGDPEEVVKKIWTDWEAFASYAFNKSHSTCYAYIAFQTAYLKAHFPAAFMASVLNHNKSDISKINFFLQETKRMKIDVLGPDINKSNIKFAVNSKGQIRFGLSALKGVGEGPVEEIVKERKENGHFEDVFDMMRRFNSLPIGF